MSSYTGDKDFDELLERCFNILKTKSVDYAEDGDRLAEFRATAEEMGITMRQALGVYINKHLRSLKKWVKGEELKGEPIEEKLLDIIVYCLLGYKMVVEEEEKEESLARSKQWKPDIDLTCDGLSGECNRRFDHMGPCKS